MKTHFLHAEWLSLVETPHGKALQIFTGRNVSRQANAVLFMTNRQWAGVKKQKPIKVKNKG